MVFYDNRGRPTAYIEDNVHIYLFTGEPVAYLDRDAAYGFNGHQFGWFENGWVRDLDGCCVFFTENATGPGPIKPVKHVKRVRRIKAAKKMSWSQLSGEAFFAQ